MFELKICCDELKEMIDNGTVKIDFMSGVVTMRDRRIYKCPACGRAFEWVE